jgi:hypothetical protein
VQNALADALTIDSTSLATFSGVIAISGANGGRLAPLGVGEGFSVRTATGTNKLILATTSTPGFINSSDGIFGFSSAATPNNPGGADLRLFRDAANTLAQRNGANAQAFRVYNTYTDASNYERFAVDWSSNVVRLGTQAEGSGSARAVRIGSFEIGGGGSATIQSTVQVGIYSGKLSLYDAVNLEVGTTTGTKIGTGTTQKIGFWNATPVVQPTAVADATDAPSVITQLNALLAHMRTIGLIAT